MIDDALKSEVIKWSAFYEHRIRLGSVSCVSAIVESNAEADKEFQKHIFHLEAFVAKFMRILERWRQFNPCVCSGTDFRKAT